MHFRVYAAALMVTWAGSLVVAQKVTTPDELDKTMKKVQPAMRDANKAIKSNAYADAVKYLAIVRQAVDDSREFWVQNRKEDAIKANKETVAKIEAAEKLLSGSAPDAMAAQAALKEIGGACRTCHEVYRVRDADNNWVLKPGTIGG